ncbi:MAG: hypothetical protein ACOY94_10035 [Bacillota bacterium]
MGEFLVNLFVRSAERDAVVDAVKPILRPAYVRANTQSRLHHEDTALYVAPSIRGWVGIFDLLMEAQDERLCEQAVRELSASLQTVALTFLMHDGEFIRYWLARGGRLLDRYHSAPDYFGPVTTAEMKRLQGRPAILADACGKPLAALAIARTLRDPDWEGLGSEMLETICESLEIPNLRVGFNTMAHDVEEGTVEGWEAFRAVSLRELLGA